MLKKIGKVSENEKYQILHLFQGRLAIEELIAQLEEFNFEKMKKMDIDEKEKIELLKSLNNDLITSKDLYNNWWKENGEKYQWEINEQAQWSIDFDSNEIFLVKD